MDLDAYRGSAQTFFSELTAEHHRHYAGLKDQLEIGPIYDKHTGLFTREAVEALRDAAAAAPAGGDEPRRRRILLDFAVDGHLGQRTKDIEAEIARREAELSIEVDGERIGFRESTVVQANEPDAERRARIERARLGATDRELSPLYVESLERQHAGAVGLGYASYRDMCAELKALDLAGLHAQTEAFSRETDAGYGGVLEPELVRTLGLGMPELRRSDLPRFFRDPDEDASFPPQALVSSFVETVRGLGIEIAAQPGVVLDVEPRKNKSPRPFCAPVHVPDQVYLVIAPIGGRNDFSALFHEGGHTEHFAHVDPGLPFEFRQLGDNAITEAYAFLFQHLVEDPEWLSRRLEVGDAGAIRSHARAERLMYLRRYAAKLAYELELHGGTTESGLDRLADRYSELLGAALQIPWPREKFLVDVDPGFYCACYLRAWALETHLRAHLRERFGLAWFDVPEAGAALQALWRDGQRLTAEELLGELTGEKLDFGILVNDLELKLAAPPGAE